MVVDILQQAANLFVILFIIRWAQLKLQDTDMGNALAYLFH
jgi:hypothetical protein